MTLNFFKTWVKLHPFWQYPVRVLYAKSTSLSSFFQRYRLSSSENKILFIIGSGRSGNTLLRRLLIENLSIYIPPESYVLGSIASSTIYGKNLPWPDLVDLTLSKFYFSSEFETFEYNKLAEDAKNCKNWPKSKQTTGNVIHSFYQSLAIDKNIPSEWMGDKTPVNTFNLGLLKKMFPKASFIYLERDGVDVVNSYLKAGLYSTLEEASLRWVESRKAWENFRPSLSKRQYVEVKYEDIVRNYKTVIKSIETNLSIPRRHSPIDSSNLLGDVSSYSHHAAVSKSVSTTSIGKGRRELSAENLMRIAKILNEDLKTAGYDTI